MFKFLISKIAQYLAGITKADFLQLVQLVQQYEGMPQISGSTKAGHVGEWIARTWGNLPLWVQDTLRQLALAWIRGSLQK